MFTVMQVQPQDSKEIMYDKALNILKDFYINWIHRFFNISCRLFPIVSNVGRLIISKNDHVSFK